MAREFQRRIQLPSDVDPGKLSSTLSTDGILTVEAPVPPRYQAVVGPQNHGTVGRTAAAVETRSSPVTARREHTVSLHDTGGRRSPYMVDAGGRRSPFLTRPVVPGNGGGGGMLRSSPVMFGSLAAPVTALPVVPVNVDVPLYTTDPATGQRRMELVLELGRPYTAEDVVVRVDGRRLTVEARHEARDQQGRVTTSNTQKQFDVEDRLDESSVRATLRDDARMVITGYIKH